ncbi:MAG TPA: MASE3 domain-containing protein [Coriobacteriia bacterium]
MKTRWMSDNLPYIGFVVAVAVGLYASSLYSYLLFHGLIEITTIAIGFALFILVWNTRRFLSNSFLSILGIGYASIAVIDLLHTLAYKGMNVFLGFGTNLPTQLWIAARYLQAVTILAALLFVRRRVDNRIILGVYAAAVSVLTALIFSRHFPDAYIEGRGLTPFKIDSEYVITVLLIVSLYLLYRQRKHFNGTVFYLAAASVAFTVLSEVSFTAYVSVYGFANLVGHFAKLAAFYLIYRAILVTGLQEPFDLIFTELSQAQEALEKARDTLEDQVEERTAELRASEEKYRALVECANDAVFIQEIEEDGTPGPVVEVNEVASEQFGYGREELAELSPAGLNDPLYPGGTTRITERLLKDGHAVFETAQIAKDGRSIPVEVSARVIEVGGGRLLLSLVRDITERRQAEQLRIAKEAAERASAAKSAFLANMSHEIRTPMNAILGFSQLMRRDKGLSERQRQQLDTINSSGEHLLALINDVLEMSKVEAGRVSTHPAAFALQSLLDEMGSLFALRAEAKGLEFRVTCSDEVPRFVVTDENKLRQILVNLLGNAVKFTDTGGIELRVATRHDDAGKLRLLVEVRDTGRGIAPEDMGRLFQHFEQVVADRTADTGTGLGLAISREFVRLLGGEIEVESTLGAGSVFRFDIAIERAAAEAVVGVAEKRHVAGLRPGEPRYRVLVADDDPTNRELLVQLLEPVGFIVRSVSDGKAALDEYERWHPHLILMDMRMPVMDGYEATRRIRAMPGGADVAVIGVTASVFAEMRQGVFDAGVDEFVGKPFHESELFEKIAKLLGAHYVYEDEAATPESESEGAFSAEALATLPKDLADRIRLATVNADFDTVLELADEVGRTDQPLATALCSLAERFDAERILAAMPGGDGS